MLDQSTTAAEVRTAAHRDLAEGDHLARYRLRRIVGIGAMGVVWAGYDPDLDREVAIKVLREGDPDMSARTRLLREARAMARLKHPNVLTVYEVGTEANRDYIVMELVDGGSLGDWLATKRPRGEILAALLAAGRGLEAAHDAGVIHRDFKPHNVLRASDGRVMVTDFGLARERAADVVSTPPTSGLDDTIEATPHPAKPIAGSVLGSPLTGTGLMVGTPAYMAPELIGGAPSDAGTDQFAFCVTAWQALAGQRPFQADSLEGLQSAAAAGPSAIKASMPAAIRAVLERGLDPDPAKRWPSLTPLLAAFERARRKRTIQLVAVLAVAVVVVATAVGARVLRSHGEPCTGADRELARVWNDRIKASARAAFLATGLPYAAPAWSTAEHALDGYGRAWIDMHDDTCKATTVRGEQSAEAMDLRMSCLAQRLQQLDAAAGVFAHADRQTVDKAGEVAAGLAPLADCADVAALGTAMRPPKDAATRSIVDELRGRLAEVGALVDSAKYAAAARIAEPALAAARATHYEPIVAEALLSVGRLRVRARQDEQAEQALQEAFMVAEASGNDTIAIRAAAELTQHVGSHLAREQDGLLWARMGRALIARRGGDRGDEAALARAAGDVFASHGHYDPALVELRRALALVGADTTTAARIRGGIGSTLDGQGKPGEALAEFRRALAIAETTDGVDSPLVVTLHGDIGVALYHAGNYADALAEQQRVLASDEKVAAPAPSIAITLDAIGTNQLRLGKLDDALATFRRALALRVQALGPDHPDVADSHVNLGATLQQLAKYDESLVEYRLALVIQEKAKVPPQEAGTHNNIGVVLQSQGKYDEALAEYRRALALREQVLGADHPDVAVSHANIAAVLQDQARFKDALVELQRALAIQDKVLGPDHPDTANTLAGIGEAYLGLGDFHRAADFLHRGLDVIERKSPDPEALGEFRFALAKAMVGDHQDHARAIELGRAARDAYASLPGHAKERNEIDRWLASHAKA